MIARSVIITLQTTELVYVIFIQFNQNICVCDLGVVVTRFDNWNDEKVIITNNPISVFGVISFINFHFVRTKTLGIWDNESYSHPGINILQPTRNLSRGAKNNILGYCKHLIPTSLHLNRGSVKTPMPKLPTIGNQLFRDSFAHK